MSGDKKEQPSATQNKFDSIMAKFAFDSDEQKTYDAKFLTIIIQLVVYCSSIMATLNKNGLVSINPMPLVDDIVDHFQSNYTKGSNSMIKTFIYNSYGMWNDLYNKSESYFYQNAKKIFPGVPEIILNKFLEFLSPNSKALETIKKQKADVNIWEKVHSLIHISIEYIHNFSGPYMVVKGNSNIPAYQKLESTARSELIVHVKKWEMINKLDMGKSITFAEYEKNLANNKEKKYAKLEDVIEFLGLDMKKA